MTALLERPQADQAEAGRSQFYVDFNFTREVIQDDSRAKAVAKAAGAAEPKAAKGDLVLSGYASTWVMDRDFEFILRGAYDQTIDSYLTKNPIVLWQHNHDWPIGQIASAITDDTGLGVQAYIRKPAANEDGWRISAFNDIAAGIVRTFSVGGWFTREFVDGEIFVTAIDLFEISVVSVPSNPDSVFEAAAKSCSGRQTNAMFTDKMASQAAQLLGMEPLSDPMLVRMNAEGMQGHYRALSQSSERVRGWALPPLVSWRMLDARIGQDDADPALLAAGAEHLVEQVYGKRTDSERGKGISLATQKAGRILSKANEGSLRHAVAQIGDAQDAIRAILDKLPDEQPQEEAASGEHQAAASTGGDTKGAFSDTMAGWDLQDDLYDAFWALRTALMMAIDPDADPYGLPDVNNINLNAVIQTCNEFRDFVVALCQEAATPGEGEELSKVATDLKTLADKLGKRERKEAEEKDKERHCPSCGTYMPNKEGATCPNCGHTLSKAEHDEAKED